MLTGGQCEVVVEFEESTWGDVTTEEFFQNRYFLDLCSFAVKIDFSLDVWCIQ